jgi:ubiquitin carboxyl-terminal hydrolase 34
MLAMIQQFYMIPTFRYELLAADDKRAPIIDNPKNVDDNILHQLQRIFAHLELTERQDYKPDKFCFAFKDLDGIPTNISIQQDAQEFLNLIFDRLETLLANTPQKYLLQNVFGGKTCSQVICKGGCGQVRRNYEDFYNLSLGVRGNTTIYQALDNFIASDTINDVNCEHCGRKVNVAKRTCLSKLPNILVVHLQRLLFNYDTMMNEKINSRLEFPKEFSIEPYTIEGIEAREKAVDANNLPKDYFLHGNDAAYYEYKLAGVVVHYGTADAGHYYSYININRKCKAMNKH